MISRDHDPAARLRDDPLLAVREPVAPCNPPLPTAPVIGQCCADRPEPNDDATPADPGGDHLSDPSHT